MNIWVSSLVGSYTFIMGECHNPIIVFSTVIPIPPFPGIGMFTYTELSEIVLLVVKKFSISGFYTAHIDCPLQTIG